MGKTGFITVMIMSVIATMMVQSAIGQTVHVVGDSLGWTVTGNDDVYDNWADTRVFRVGDILTFNFTTGEHDVVEVTEASYDACTSTNTIGNIITTGPANITLTTVGEHNYICTIGNGRHCQNGQKLDITVVAAIASPPPPTTTTPPPPGTIASPPPPTTTTPPPTIAPPPPSTAKTVHVVGDSLGWTVTGNDDVYENWADTRIFRVGDILTFNFTTGEHDVVEVTEASHDACSSTNTIGSIITTGPANITLTTAGEHYYICTFAGGRHCQNGQKLDINVLAAAQGTIAPPPPPTTTAPPPSLNGPAPSPTIVPSPPPSTYGPRVSPTTAPPPSSTYEPTASPATSPPPPSTNGPTTSPTTTSPPPDGSSSSVVLGGVFVTFVSLVFGLFM